jgi:hypothetical protein
MTITNKKGDNPTGASFFVMNCDLQPSLIYIIMQERIVIADLCFAIAIRQ